MDEKGAKNTALRLLKKQVEQITRLGYTTRTFWRTMYDNVNSISFKHHETQTEEWLQQTQYGSGTNHNTITYSGQCH